MTLRVKDWHTFQHFKDRRPPWIKLYRNILDDLEWHKLDPVAAKSLVMLWLIASENDGNLPADDVLSFRLRIPEKQVKSIITSLSHWLIQDDITPISTRYQRDSPETETETEGEGETKTSLSDAPTVGEETEKVFAHWKEVMNHPQAQLGKKDSKRYRAIASRLKEGYSADQLCSAINGCKNSPHHMGENDRHTVYDDIELICRDSAHVDKFIRLANSKLLPMSANGRKAVTAAQAFMESFND